MGGIQCKSCKSETMPCCSGQDENAFQTVNSTQDNLLSLKGSEEEKAIQPEVAKIDSYAESIEHNKEVINAEDTTDAMNISETDKFDGFWKNASDSAPICTIDNGKLHWRVGYGDSIDVTINEEGELVAVLSGQTSTAILMNGEIVWDDGDRWARDDKKGKALIAYDGFWVNAETKAPVCQIEHGVLTWLTKMNKYQKQMLEIDENDKLQMTFEGATHKGAIQAGTLVWSDGDKWVLK